MVYYENFPAYEMQRPMLSSHSYRDFHLRSLSPRQGVFLIKAAIVALALAGIMAVVVPRYVNAEKSGKELTIKGFLRTIAAVNKQYRSRYRKYAGNLGDLAGEARIEALVESAERTGYAFSYRGGRNAWTCGADPGEPGPAHFFADESGRIRFRAEGPASSSDAEIK